MTSLCSPTESLKPSTTQPVQGELQDDFDRIPDLLEPPEEPAYILVKLDGDSNDDDDATRAPVNAGGDGSAGNGTWLLATYVPDKAHVRSKMLYSSSKAALARQLGEGSFKYSLFASTKVRYSAMALVDARQAPGCFEP